MEPEQIQEEPLNEVNYMTDEQFQEFITSEKAEHIELLELEATRHEEILTKIDELNTNLGTKLDNVNESIGSIPQVDISELGSTLSDLNLTVNNLIESMAIIEGASSSVITYAVYLVPLCLIVTCGWWFFKQFIK